MKNNGEIKQAAVNLSTNFDYNISETAVILAAGHGKRIKSQTSKMLHKIWEVPTVERVYNACEDGLGKANKILVVGIKALDVMNVIGKRENTLFTYQENQNGTGHAVQVALENVKTDYEGIVYVFPGDMGLIDAETVKDFREGFIKSQTDMMVLTGLYEGDPAENNYGRIIRVKEFDDKGKPSGEDSGKVIEIIEHKDILRLPDDKPYTLNFKGRSYSYTRQELINNNEFNSSVYAFKSKYLFELLNKIESNNAQSEIYITDLIYLFNKAGYSVGAVNPRYQYTIMGFNNKSVLKEMNSIARKNIYMKLKDIIEIDDPDDFFIHEKVVEQIIESDTNGTLLDIRIGKGVYIGEDVLLNQNVTLMKNVFLDGRIKFGKNVIVRDNTQLTCFKDQTLVIEDNVEIFGNDLIKGNVVIGKGSSIESGVHMTGSDEFPLRIGKHVVIKGTTYLFGSIVDDHVYIEHSVLIKKNIVNSLKDKGTAVKIRFYIPMPEGNEAIKDL